MNGILRWRLFSRDAQNLRNRNRAIGTTLLALRYYHNTQGAGTEEQGDRGLLRRKQECYSTAELCHLGGGDDVWGGGDGVLRSMADDVVGDAERADFLLIAVEQLKADSLTSVLTNGVVHPR